MVALHHALEDGNQKGVQKISELYKDRGHGDGRVNKIGNDFTLKFIPSSNGKKRNGKVFKFFLCFEDSANYIRRVYRAKL